jgi:hypothetical protein
MNFERGKGVIKSTGIGLSKGIPKMLEDLHGDIRVTNMYMERGVYSIQFKGSNVLAINVDLDNYQNKCTVDFIFDYLPREFFYGTNVERESNSGRQMSAYLGDLYSNRFKIEMGIKEEWLDKFPDNSFFLRDPKN